jgi:hypothetical protein
MADPTAEELDALLTGTAARCNDCGTVRATTYDERTTQTIKPCACGSGAYRLGFGALDWTPTPKPAAADAGDAHA